MRIIIPAIKADIVILYKAMSDFGKPITSQELANLSATSERYIRVWLANQAAGGYLTYYPTSQTYTLPIESQGTAGI